MVDKADDHGKDQADEEIDDDGFKNKPGCNCFRYDEMFHHPRYYEDKKQNVKGV